MRMCGSCVDMEAMVDLEKVQRDALDGWGSGPRGENRGRPRAEIYARAVRGTTQDRTRGPERSALQARGFA